MNESHPNAAQVARESYDCLTGVSTSEEAIQLQQELNSMLAKGGFLLWKWRSNSQAALAAIPEELEETEVVKELPTPAECCHKPLGIHWDPQQDCFHAAIPKFNSQENLTKQKLTSDIARTFNIMGWYTPATIMMKTLLQNIWELKSDWDEEVPSNLQNSWHVWREKLHYLNENPISQCYFKTDSSVKQIEPHGFSDASEKAYAAVAYLKANYENLSASVTLVMAKSKVAP